MGNNTIKKESIVFTAIDLINEYGIQAVSTREVAKRQDISQGTVFQYFPKKNDLLKAVLEHFSLYDNDLYNSAKARKTGRREALVYYMDSYALYYENYPEITAVMQAFDVFRNDPELGGQVKSIYQKREAFMRELVDDAIISGTLRKDIGSEVISGILTAVMRGMILKWRMGNCGFPLRDETMKAAGILLEAFSV